MYEVAVLMMQKEVAQRVTAGPGSSSRGSLSVYLQAHHEIAALIDAPAGAFLPPPKVDSRVLVFRPRPEDPALDESFFALVRKGFVQPRKTLANNLVAGFGLTRDQATVWVEAAGLGEKARPQELSLEEWRRLASARPSDLS
jgi:16S rRNA (adenine1518-N6/adenine1519-N6)-dimethyltransferase